MTGEEAALRRAVLENPEDDNPRLVYADWCLDNGFVEEGTYIHSSIIIHNRGKCHCTYRRGRLITRCPGCEAVSRVAEMGYGNLVRPWPEWSRRHTGGTPPAASPTWRRGFVGGFRCRWPNLGKTIRPLFSQNPVTAIVIEGLVVLRGGTHDATVHYALAEWMPQQYSDIICPEMDRVESESRLGVFKTVSDALVRHYRKEADLPDLSSNGFFFGKDDIPKPRE